MRSPEPSAFWSRVRVAPALLIALLAVQGDASPRSAVACDVTPYNDMLPEVVAPLAGEHPIWLVTGDRSGSDLAWVRPECGVKTLWVIAREAVGDLIVEGRRLDGPGELTFKQGQSERSSRLVVTNASTERSVTPGGASAEILRLYSFWPSAIYYPSMGCWELRARLGESEVRVVQHRIQKVDSNCGLDEALP